MAAGNMQSSKGNSDDQLVNPKEIKSENFPPSRKQRTNPNGVRKKVDNGIHGYRQARRALEEIEVESLKGDYCKQKFLELVVPEWYFFFTANQLETLEELPKELSDDFDEGCIRRCKNVSSRMNLLPCPSAKNLYKAIRSCKGNPVIFLSTLSGQLPKSEDSESSYSLNKKILMTAIAYFEVPMFLSLLENKLTSSGLIPQLGGKRMKAPEDMSRTNYPLTHLVKKEDVRRKHQLAEKPTCRVLQMCGNSKPPAQSEEPEPKYKDLKSAMRSTMRDLREQGMISAKYPQFLKHPIILQYVKHVKGEKVSKEILHKLAAVADSSVGCVRQLYKEHSLPLPVSNAPDNTWAKAKVAAEENRKQFFLKLWKESNSCLTHTGHILSPSYSCTRAFLPVYSAYLPNSNPGNHVKVCP